MPVAEGEWGRVVKAIVGGGPPHQPPKKGLGSMAAASLLQTPTRCLFDVSAVAFLHTQVSLCPFWWGGSHAAPRKGMARCSSSTGAIRAPEYFTHGVCMGMLCFALMRLQLQGENCWPAASSLCTKRVPPCTCCDRVVPLLPPCLHREPVWCI